MKSFVKKVMVVFVVLATIVDWPVEIEAINAKPIVKEGTSLLKSCSKSTKFAEEKVNKATQATKKIVNETTENPNVQRGAIYGGSRMINNATRSSAQTTSQPRMVSCPRCYGRGNVQGKDGYVYSCSRCNGTGTICCRDYDEDGVSESEKFIAR